MNLLIVTPLFPPAVGGASTYYKLLTRELIESEGVDHVVVVTERHSEAPNRENLMGGRLTVLRLFPARAGRDRRRFIQYPQYLLQNIEYFLLPWIRRRYAIDKVLIHSGLHNVLNTLWIAQRLLTALGTECIADVRDWQLPIRRFYQLRRYNRIICCSEHVFRHISEDPLLAEKAARVPVIQERLLRPSAERIKGVLQRLDLLGRDYLLYVGLIRKSKGVDQLLDIFAAVLAEHPGMKLVLVGNMRDEQDMKTRVAQAKGVRYAGALPREDVLALLSGCRIAVNLSPSEGMPRSSLEALALDVPTILPPNIPEFDSQCPQVVHSTLHPEETVSKINTLLDRGDRCNYAIASHYPEHVVPRYLEVLTHE